MLRWKPLGSFVGLGILSLFLFAAGHDVGTSAETVFDGELLPVDALVTIAVSDDESANEEVELVVTYGVPPQSETKTIKKGEPLSKTYPKLKKITAKKKNGSGSIKINVTVTPVTGGSMVASTWRTTATEEAIALARAESGGIAFSVHADPGSVATIVLKNGDSVVAERTIDSSDDWNGTFHGTSVLVRAGSGTGTLEYHVLATE